MTRFKNHEAKARAPNEERIHFDVDRSGQTRPTEVVPLLPNILLNARQFRYVTRDAEDALVRANDPPTLFMKGRFAVHIPHGGHESQVLNWQQLGNYLKTRANWFRENSEGKLTPASPRKDLAEDLIATWARRGSKLPTLKSVTGNPILRADGSIFDSPGYDPETQLYYAPADELVLEAMPDRPTPHEIEEAAATLGDVFCDFPFDGDSSRCHLLALLITHVCRHLIDGQTPLFLLDKPKVGTGASLLVDVVSAIASGKPAIMRPAPNSKEEWRKDITAIVLDGEPLVVFDNVSGTIKADPLAGVITANSWSDRRLGYSETTGELPTGHITWVMTGNNIRLRSDLARRSVSIRLDARLPRPWQGRSFRHKNLLQHVEENRGRLLSAIYTLMRAWMRAERPSPSTELLGSFEEWSEVVGGVCEFAGISGFLANRDSLYESMDEDHTEWLEFLSAIYDLTKGEPFLAKELRFGCDGIDPEVLPMDLADKYGKTSFVRALGRAFAQKKDARYDEYCVVHVSNDTKSKRSKVWRVVYEEAK